MSMTKHVKTRWLRALRSGKYAQGFGRLRSKSTKTPEHCCLGVLVDCAGERWRQPYSGGDGAKPLREWKMLPASLLRRFRLADYDARELATLNDNTGIGFTGIASWIEKNL